MKDAGQDDSRSAAPTATRPVQRTGDGKPSPSPVSRGGGGSPLSFSKRGSDLLKQVERLRLSPYDDQTAQDITRWVAGATIGYGHLISNTDWHLYQDGITQADADEVFDKDAAPFVAHVRKAVTAPLSQQQFDALVILAFNIGPDFVNSSVVKLINDPTIKTAYSGLEQAWKAWNKSQGKIMKGLDNRRQCEWNMYTLGEYKGW